MVEGEAVEVYLLVDGAYVWCPATVIRHSYADATIRMETPSGERYTLPSESAAWRPSEEEDHDAQDAHRYSSSQEGSAHEAYRQAGARPAEARQAATPSVGSRPRTRGRAA